MKVWQADVDSHDAYLLKNLILAHHTHHKIQEFLESSSWSRILLRGWVAEEGERVVNKSRQDGYLRSEVGMDQALLWDKDEWIQMPLAIEKALVTFRFSAFASQEL
jgi:hypothetical protein